MPADPKPAARIVDPAAVARARLSGDECVACGRPPGSVHHVIPRGEGGDDVAANLVLLCGTGTTGCHGAHHGNPWYPEWIERERTAAGGWTAETLRLHGIPWPPPSGWKRALRHDAEWVNRRIGVHIASRRPDTIRYVIDKLGDYPGRDYLRRIYFVEQELET